MAEIIKIKIIRKDAFLFAEAPQWVEIPCTGAKLVDIVWMRPLVKDGIVVEYQTIIDTAANKPTPDSIRIGVIDTGGNRYYAVLADNATDSVFTNACNACCGSTPTLADVAIFPPIVQDCPCADASGNYIWDWPLPYNPNTLAMLIGGTFDGAAATPAYTSTGFANAAALLTWVQANWGAYGTWSLTVSSTVLHLTSTTTKCAGVNIPLVPAVYCLSLPADHSALLIDGIDIGGTVSLFPSGPISVSDSNPSALQFALNGFLVGTVTVVAGAPTKIAYVGYQAPVALRYNGGAVSGGSFTSGACTWTFSITIPADVGGQNYHVTQASFNGVVATTDITGQAFATIATMLTWLNANWAYGTWTSPDGTHILLTSTTTYTVTGLTVTQS